MPNGLKLLFGDVCARIYHLGPCHDYCYQCHFSTPSFVSATIHSEMGAASHFCNETKHFVMDLKWIRASHTLSIVCEQHKIIIEIIFDVKFHALVNGIGPRIPSLTYLVVMKNKQSSDARTHTEL